MADESHQVPGGNDQKPGGSSGDQRSQANTSEDGKVSYDSYKKLLDEKKALSTRLSEFEKAQQEREEQAKREKEDFKGLADQYKAELEATKAELGDIKGHIKRSQKVNALLETLEGRIDPKYWHLIDDAKIVMDDEGNVDKMSVKKYAEQFSKDFPDVIKRPVTSDLPPTTPKGANGSYISVAEYQQMARDPKISKKELWEARSRIKPAQ